jgi:O-acetyl-ADP-ribose deacetylase (regulator of RNase III)
MRATVLEFAKGNLFEADVQALVNTVNTVGVMGKGIALQFSRQFPEIIRPYQAACKSGSLVVGRVQTIQLSRLKGMSGPEYVINFPTKKHWKGDSKIEYIDSGLQSLRSEIERLGLKSIAIPPLGCGLGGLDWTDVRRRIFDALADMDDVHIQVYEPAGAPSAKAMKPASKIPKMTASRAALLRLMQRYKIPLLDDSITLLEIHKLAYFMQEAGEPLRLHFVKGIYGPYATNLRHVLKDIEGHFLVGFGDASEQPGKVLELLPGAIEKAESFLNRTASSDTLGRFVQVEELLEGFETAYGLELLGSVHWVAKHEPLPAKTPEEATALVHAWNVRKQNSFPSEHIEVAWERLAATGWV